MGTNLPNRIPDLINWATVHEDLWSTNAVAIGLTAAQATSFKNLVTTLDAANANAQQARQASKDATLTLNNAVSNIRTMGGALVNTIKAYAETTNNPNVYTLAGVSPDDAPGTVPAPVPPTEISAGVNSDGSLTLKWKASQPQGVTNVQYYVYRAVNGAQAFTLAGASGSEKTFIDTTLPYGLDRVDYMIQPRRGNVIGAQSNTFTLRFGSVGTGPTIAGNIGGGNGTGMQLNVTSTPNETPVQIAA